MAKKNKKISISLSQIISILEGRWTLFILCELLRHETRRFQDILSAYPRMAPNTLSDRLEKLEEVGIIEREFYEMRPPRAHYMLTACGKDLEPIIDAMESWGNQYIE